MTTLKTYDNFPLRIVILSNFVSVLIYGLGFLITLRAGWLLAVSYLAFILLLEYRLISRHCVDCYYYAKTCGFAKGRISSLFFRRGDQSKFCGKTMTWKDVIPDLLITLFPVITGIIFLIIDFNILVLVALVVMILAATMGNSIIRGSFTCKFCRQREIGCPAEKLFSGKQ